jgi:hypothetical protein
MVPPPPKQYRHRELDVSFWGYHKCERVGNRLSPKPTNPPNEVNPDVVSWGASFDYGTHALNDVIIRSETFGSDTAPRIGYLIKVRREGTPGLDVYKVPHGTTVDDAVNNRNGAEHEAYNAGGPDIVITITPSDLGIDVPASGIWGRIWGRICIMLCGNFEISMERLYRQARI